MGFQHLTAHGKWIRSLKNPKAKRENTMDKASGIELIAAERQRQTEAESWTAPQSNSHKHGELAVAAMRYAAPPEVRAHYDHIWGRLWPWHGKYWKPTPDNRIRELVKSGALIAAEIDRIQRLEE